MNDANTTVIFKHKIQFLTFLKYNKKFLKKIKTFILFRL